LLDDVSEFVVSRNGEYVRIPVEDLFRALRA